MVKALVKTTLLEPGIISSDKVRLILLERKEGEWSEHRFRMSENIIDRMIVLANNYVITNMRENAYVFAEVEVPGLRAFIGEGRVPGVETFLTIMPEPVLRIVFYKLEGEEVKPLHVIEPKGELWGYESKIYVEPGFEYDLIIVETPNFIRAILPDELKFPQKASTVVKTRTIEAKKKSRKSRKKTKKTRKKTKKKTRRKRGKKKKKSKKK